MGAYILRRLLLMIPTIVGIMAISFTVIQFAPGGPVEQVISDLTGQNQGGDRLSGGSGDLGMQAGGDEVSGKYRGAQGLDPEFIAKLEKQFGFDKPPLERFGLMMWNYIRFDFGESFFRNTSVIDLILEKMPVSISLGLWILSVFLRDLHSARHQEGHLGWLDLRCLDLRHHHHRLCGSELPFRHPADRALCRRLVLRLVSAARHRLGQFRQLTWWQKILDYFWHMTLPLITLLLSAFATTTLLTKNSFIDEIKKQYVTTARAKGLNERQVLYGHVFRNAMLIIIAGFPGAFISAFFTGSLLIEYIFSLDGLGRLGYESVVKRDYPIVFATLYIFSLMGLLVSLLSDLIYTWVDPRIDFERRDV